MQKNVVFHIHRPRALWCVVMLSGACIWGEWVRIYNRARRRASLRWLLWWLIIGTLAVADGLVSIQGSVAQVCCHLGITWDLPFWHGTCEARERIDMANGCCVSRRAHFALGVFYRDIAMGIIETWPNNDLTLMRLYQQCIVWDSLSADNRPSELSRCVKEPSGRVATHTSCPQVKMKLII